MDKNVIIKSCPESVLMGISIVSLQNEGFQSFSVMLNYKAPSWFFGEIQNLGDRWLSMNSSWGNAMMAFRYRCSFMYAVVSDINYYSRK